MRSTSLSFLGFLVVGVAVACGGADKADLGSGGHTSSGSSGGGSGSGSSSGSGSGSGSSSGSTSSSGSGSGSSSGGVEDASTQDVVVDVVEPMDTGPKGPAVLCPMQGQPATCMAGDYCCVTGDAQLGTQMDNCEPPGGTCVGTPVHCASAADCQSGYVCCGQKDATGMMYMEVGCRQQCNGTGQITFCDPAAMDCPSTAPTCQQSTLLQGYNVCQ